MSETAFEKIKSGLEEAVSIAKGEQPAASIFMNGHTYVPKAQYDLLRSQAEALAVEIEAAKLFGGDGFFGPLAVEGARNFYRKKARAALEAGDVTIELLPTAPSSES